MKQVAWLVVALMACSGTAAEAPAVVRSPAVGAMAAVGMGGLLRVSRGDAGAAAERVEEGAVVATEGDDIQLRFDAGDVQLALWTAASTLAPVIMADAPVGAVDGGVILRPGAPVTVLERRGDRARIRHTGAGVTVEGEIAAAAIGQRYTRTPVASTGEVSALRNRTEVRAAPGGAVLAVVANDTIEIASDVRRTGPVVDGWAPISVTTPDVVVRGVVPAAEVGPPEGIFGFLAGGTEDGTVEVAIEVGACLHDRPGGAVVGTVTKPVTWAARGDADGWYWLTVGVAGATVEVAARPGAPCPVSAR